MAKSSSDTISMKYDMDALLNHTRGELGSFHVGYYHYETSDHREAMHELIKQVVAPLDHCSHVLDLGCGFGYPTKQADEILLADLTGIDFSRKSIEIAREIHAKEIFANGITFQEMDAYDMQFEDELFDGVFAVESLFHMEKGPALKEVYRVLAKNGTLSISDYYSKESWEDRFEEGFSQMIPLEDFVSTLEACGFRSIEVIDWTKQIRPSFSHLKHRKMHHQSQEEWDQFCEAAQTQAGYANIVARK